MGIAAYNRGSRAISFQIATSASDRDLQLLRDVTEFSQREAKVAPFEPGVIRLDRTSGGVSLMNKQATGWASQSFDYPSLWALAREWRVALISFGIDEHSPYLSFVPIPVGQTVEQWP